jgi:hypothetical protein
LYQSASGGLNRIRVVRPAGEPSGIVIAARFVRVELSAESVPYPGSGSDWLALRGERFNLVVIRPFSSTGG